MIYNRHMKNEPPPHQIAEIQNAIDTAAAGIITTGYAPKEYHTILDAAQGYVAIAQKIRDGAGLDAILKLLPEECRPPPVERRH